MIDTSLPGQRKLKRMLDLAAQLKPEDLQYLSKALGALGYG